MIEYGYVPLKKTIMYKLLSEYKSNGKVDDEYHISGWSLIITMKKIDISIDKHSDKTVQAITTREIVNILNIERQKNSIAGPLFCQQISRLIK